MCVCARVCACVRMFMMSKEEKIMVFFHISVFLKACQSEANHYPPTHAINTDVLNQLNHECQRKVSVKLMLKYLSCNCICNTK